MVPSRPCGRGRKPTALEVAADVRSGQAISALSGTARTLFPYRQRPQVREQHERLVVLAAG
ncbi:hypothetical protein DN069_38520 [Streptacidiphilus pinicola]|uniref:Uncharacterized protein n=1 Tax=Streptacidiphilus pinicola TaxID=2219663 RepID=A0A2X0I5Y9_9ACTN|nr:hypothetical protein DN069_38520 [Streptacidiphilus pinicola]